MKQTKIYSMSLNDSELIQTLTFLQKIQKNPIVYQENIKELYNLVDILKNNKKNLIKPTFNYYQNYIINDLFINSNYMIGRYRCQNMPTAKRLRSNKHLFIEYDDIINNYVPTIYKNISTIWKYVSTHSNQHDI